jgi:3-oxoacyl-[acyl-carrier-protein] synthase-3
MASRSKARIISLGSYLPSTVLSNQDLEKMVETSDDWIVSRTGMKERRLAHAQEFSSDMGAHAARIALEKAKISTEEIDLILVATMSPDYISPSTAAIIQSTLGAFNAAALDLQAACSGFIYALSTAKAFIESGTYKNILVVASEKMSAFIDYKDRNTCVLFGDGAAAAVVTNHGSGFLINNVCLGADGALAQLLLIPAGGARHPTTHETVAQRMHYMKMSGKELFKHAVRRMGSAATECLTKMELTEKDISWLVPHQANERIIDAISKALSIPDEKVYKTLHKYGNTSASSVGIALDELTQEHTVANGEHVLLAAFGGGLTWGAALLTKFDGR